MRIWLFVLLALDLNVASTAEADAPQAVAWDDLASPIIFRGNATTAFRDPAAIYVQGWFYLYFTKTVIDPDGLPYQRTAWSKSRDLATWTEPECFTPKDRSLNYGSPGSVIRTGDTWVICLQTYPRPNGEAFGNDTSRIWTMTSTDLEHWGNIQPILVKGPAVSIEHMGRMIDPCLFPDKDTPGKWWCSFKQKGMSLSWSTDLTVWHPFTQVPAGENTQIIIADHEYVLFHAPSNGIGMKRSSDLLTWRDAGVQTLGQAGWPWAQGRLTAGFVLDLRTEPRVGRALLFFHGEPPKEIGGFDNFASIGMAWGADLQTWAWSQGRQPPP